MDDEYYYFSMDGNKPFKYNERMEREYLKYLDAENELESMILDNVLDIYVDSRGKFHYFPSKNTLKNLGEFAKNAKFCDFSNILETRGLSINTFVLYKNMMIRRNGK